MTGERHYCPYAFHVARDGNGVNGLEGMAGVCLFRFDPDGNRYAWKIRYFDGIGAGYAVSVNPPVNSASSATPASICSFTMPRAKGAAMLKFRRARSV